MTQDEIMRFVRTVIFMESPTTEGITEMVDKITDEWLAAQDDAFRRGQESILSIISN